jgi:hypothetical protein
MPLTRSPARAQVFELAFPGARIVSVEPGLQTYQVRYAEGAIPVPLALIMRPQVHSIADGPGRLRCRQPKPRVAGSGCAP